MGHDMDVDIDAAIDLLNELVREARTQLAAHTADLPFLPAQALGRDFRDHAIALHGMMMRVHRNNYRQMRWMAGLSEKGISLVKQLKEQDLSAQRWFDTGGNDD